MPYVKFRGKYYGDSNLIMAMLGKEYSLNLDSHLTPDQKALGHMLRRMLEDGSYFIAFYHRWLKPKNWVTHGVIPVK